MLNSAKLEKQTERQKAFFEKFKNLKNPRHITFLGKKFVIYPNVFSPLEDTRILIKSMIIPKESNVLEIGAGSGAVSIFAAQKAKKVIAVDINPDAIKCAQENVRLHKINNIEVRLSDLFENINEKFDIILANLPFRNLPTNDIIEKSMWDQDFSANERFFKEVSNYLKPKGIIYFVHANFGEIARVKELIKKYNFKIEKIYKSKKEWRIFFVYKLKKV